ncbi:hypothetical protein OG594_12765 [Streptomyces sp. NBC_01214]|uniref:hypothetical protein n=1 Tax=Streptomyces sp. NBC_01214 TaxID=2903777 RepID=UPI00225247A5|nr:hypothetical protein [Streptomyces sp. NBC_01214]MCX4802518.1 hypothetical protein [Streptomyces sp. NBC_01214]
MSRRMRPSAAPTLRIPRQRRGQPVIVVLSSELEPSLTARAAAASGRWLWKHRRTWAPTGLSLVLLAVTGLAHLIEPRTAWVLAPLALTPVGVWAWTARRRPATSRTVRTWRALLAAAVTAGVGWVPVAIWFGPVRPAVALVWALLTLTAQVVWLIARRLTTTAEETR